MERKAITRVGFHVMVCVFQERNGLYFRMPAGFQKLSLDRNRMEPAQNAAAIKTTNVRAGEVRRLRAAPSGMTGSRRAKP